MSDNKKKNYYVSETFIETVKKLARAEHLSEGKMLEKILSYYTGKEEMLEQFKQVKAELNVQKKILTAIEDLSGVTQKMVTSIAEIQGVYTFVESSNLLTESEVEWRKFKHERMVRDLNKKNQNRKG